jgi:hypothetical protein
MNAPKAILISVAIYRRLLILYPADYRREYGDAMTQLFRDQCRDAWASRRTWGLAILWFRALVDLTTSSTAERLHVPFALRAVALRISAVVFALVFVFRVLVAISSQPFYESTATIETRPFNSGPDPYFMATQANIISSDSVLTNALADLHLTDVYLAFPAENPLVVSMFPNRANPALRNSSLRYLSRHLSVELRRRTDLLEITMRMHNPTLAANIANAVASAYATERLGAYRALYPNSEIAWLAIVRDPARPARKPCLPDAADLAFPALDAALWAASAAILAVAILSLTRRRIGKGLGASI